MTAFSTYVHFNESRLIVCTSVVESFCTSVLKSGNVCRMHTRQKLCQNKTIIHIVRTMNNRVKYIFDWYNLYLHTVGLYTKSYVL